MTVLPGPAETPAPDPPPESASPLHRDPAGFAGRLLRVRPHLIMIGTFLAAIAVGTLLLGLPFAGAPGRPPISLFDAFFTATSAVCVTGLVVRDTGADFSPAGQWTILALIQAGGLGLATFVACFAFLQRRSPGLRQLLVFRDLLSFQVVGELGRYLRYVVAITLGVEAAGTALLWAATDASAHPPGEHLRWSLFHAVSAFCNAGFSLSPDSFVGAAGRPGMNAVLAGLIIAGGLGFPAIMECLRFRIGSLSVFRRRSRRPPGDPPSRLSVQTRMVFRMSLLLIAGGATVFWLFERRGVLAGRSAAEQACASLFQSVTARTAGFNTVDIGALGTPALLLLIVLMAVGASPASTGGGVKTVTVAVLLGTIRAMLRNREQVELCRRTIPRVYVHSAVAIVALYAAEVVSVTMLLSALEPALALRQVLFETVSALSTVGLSTGITAGLCAPAKVLLCAAMLAGRVGPLAVLMSMASRAPVAGYTYPREDVVVS